MFSLAKCVSVIPFFLCHYPTSAVREQTCFHLHILILYDLHDFSWAAPLVHFTFFSLSNAMPVLSRAARKTFPKRKLDESRSGSETQEEEVEAKEEQGQHNKRPRVESSPGSVGTPSRIFLDFSRIFKLWKTHKRLYI